MLTYLDIQYTGQKQSFYNSDQMESECLVWSHVFFSTTWTLFLCLLVNSWCNLQELFSRLPNDIPKFFFNCWLPFVLFSVKKIPHCYNNADFQALGVFHCEGEMGRGWLKTVLYVDLVFVSYPLTNTTYIYIYKKEREITPKPKEKKAKQNLFFQQEKLNWSEQTQSGK